MPSQKIRFKVVDHDRNSFIVHEGPYCLHYEKDRIVKAKKDTIGIMVFDTIKTAQDYINGLPDVALILEVDVRGRMKKINTVSSGVSTIDLNRFYMNASVNIMSPFPGTECYPRVKVLT